MSEQQHKNIVKKVKNGENARQPRNNVNESCPKAGRFWIFYNIERLIAIQAYKTNVVIQELIEYHAN